MIAKIRGKIDSIGTGYAIVDVGGIGYKVFMTAYLLGKLSGKKEVELFIHTHVREDILSLYGFSNKEEHDMFELLISISGIGPKAAIGILTIADPKTISASVLNEDPSILTKVSGVGKKTAERVILELKSKIADISSGEKFSATQDSEVIEAITSMGYTVQESRDALKAIPKGIDDVGEKIKQTLKILGKK